MFDPLHLAYALGTSVHKTQLILPKRKLIMLAMNWEERPASSSQFIIATHSPILMALPGAEIFRLDREGVRAVAYRETEHYQITRRFLENPERMLRCLLEKA